MLTWAHDKVKVTNGSAFLPKQGTLTPPASHLISQCSSSALFLTLSHQSVLFLLFWEFSCINAYLFYLCVYQFLCFPVVLISFLLKYKHTLKTDPQTNIFLFFIPKLHTTYVFLYIIVFFGYSLLKKFKYISKCNQHFKQSNVQEESKVLFQIRLVDSCEDCKAL